MIWFLQVQCLILFMSKGSLKYQINKTKAEQNGFKIDQTLTKLAYNPS